MHKLNLPPCELRIKSSEKTDHIFDPIRKKYVSLTPEEWVRQNFLHYLIHSKGYPKGRIAVEMPLKLNQMNRRADIVIFDHNGDPFIIVECKAASVAITQNTMDQALHYQMSVAGRILCLTNGLMHVYAMVDDVNKRFVYLRDLPDYQSLQDGELV